MGRKAQQLGPLGPQFQDLLDDRIIVLGVIIVAAAVIGPPDLFTQITLIGIGQEGVHGRAGVEHGPLTRLALLFGRGRHGRFYVARQAGEIGLRGQEQNIVGLIGQ